MTARPHPSFREGMRWIHDLRQQFVFASLVDVAVERDGVTDPQTRRRDRAGSAPTNPPPMTSRWMSGSVGRRAATASSASSICLCGTSRERTEMVGRSALVIDPPASTPTGSRSAPLRTTAIRSRSTPRSTNSSAEGSDTVRY